MEKPIPEPRIAAYIKELGTTSVVSYSHFTLMRLYKGHGKDTIDALLHSYFHNEREWDASRTRMVSPSEAASSWYEVTDKAQAREAN